MTGPYRYAVLGAGRQGVAIAYDLAVHGEAAEITLVEANRKALRAARARLRRLAPGVRVHAVERSFGPRGRGAAGLLRGHDVAVSALPYRFNPVLAEAAVRAGVSFLDLGGNTPLVREELKLHGAARRAGVTVLPDCGVAPGLGNTLAALAVREVPRARHVHIWCGGLPRDPGGPLDYCLLFSIAGLTNEYTGKAVVLREGRLQQLEAFTECEPFRGPAPLQKAEAFLTSGGTSTAPWTFRNRLETYVYKTVRYPGHYAKVRAMIELGLLDLKPVDVGGKPVVPRDLFHAAAGPRLYADDPEDLLILRVECRDASGRGLRYQMMVHKDARTGFSAMEQATGYPTAAAAHAIARRALKPGARPLETIPFDASYVTALRRRGLPLRRRRI